MKNKILILGCSSFSGAAMVNFLLDKEKYRIHGTYRRKKIRPYLPYMMNKNYKFFKSYKIDFCKNPKKILDLIIKIKPHYIIDFISMGMVNQSWNYPEIYFKTNSLNKAYILKHLSKTKFLKKYIYISTPEIFGSTKNSISEKHEIFKPSTPYATSKLGAEMILKNYFDSYKLPIIITRFSNFYGPGQPIYRLIPKVIASIDKKIKFPVEGGGSTVRNFIFSYDFCNGIYKTLLKGKIGDVYHFSGKKFYKIIDVVKIICILKSFKLKSLVKKTKTRIGQDFIYKLEASETRKKLNWKPIYSLEKGLKEVIVYHKKNFKKIPKKYFTYNDKSFKKLNVISK